MTDEFLAVRAATDLRRHAADLRQRWDDSFASGRPTGVRQVIADSWGRLLGDGIAPDELRPRAAADDDALAAARESSPLRTVLDDLRGSLAAIADDAEHIMVVADAAGTLLWIEGHERVLEQARGIDFRPGMAWTEDSAGTNAIGTALAIDHAVQIFASEHFLSEQHPWWCSAAPIHDPTTGALLGVVDLSGPQQTAHPHSLALVTAAVGLAEQSLARRTAEEQARASHRRTDRATAGRGATLPRATRWRLELFAADAPLLKRPGAGTCELSLRQAEVLALLAATPAGLGAERLTLDLYGDEGNPVTTRALVSRLRDVAGPVLDTQPYRLRWERVRVDLRTLLQLLEQGRTAAALAMYAGPLLPQSTAPAIERLRDEVDLAVRRAAFDAGADQLWRWLATPTGREDLAAHDRFLELAADDDPRRPLATARQEVLRDMWTSDATGGVVG